MTNCVGKLKIWCSPLHKTFYIMSELHKQNNEVLLQTGEVLCIIEPGFVNWLHYSFHGIFDKVINQYITDSFYLDVEPYLITYARNCVCEKKSVEASLEITYFKADVIIFLTKDRRYIIRLEKEIGYVLNTTDHIGFVDIELPRVMTTLSEIGVYSLCF